MAEHPVAFLDVFAERPLAGNGLAVVGDADGVDAEVMALFATETRLSETTFVQSTEKEADYRNRIFIPGQELPFAGHPSLGTAVAVARWLGREEASFVQETGTGLQPIEVRREEDGAGGWERWHAGMLQDEAEFGDPLDRDAALAAAGLEPGDADPEIPAGYCSTGLLTAVVPVAERAALGRAGLDPEAVQRLIAPADDAMLYLAHVDPAGGRAWARAFAPMASVGEDPATGSSGGAFAAYVAKHTGCERLTISQGVEMGRPSVIETEIEDRRVRVGGGVIPLIEGRVTLP